MAELTFAEMCEAKGWSRQQAFELMWKNGLPVASGRCRINLSAATDAEIDTMLKDLRFNLADVNRWQCAGMTFKSPARGLEKPLKKLIARRDEDV